MKSMQIHPSTERRLNDQAVMIHYSLTKNWKLKKLLNGEKVATKEPEYSMCIMNNFIFMKIRLQINSYLSMHLFHNRSESVRIRNTDSIMKVIPLICFWLYGLSIRDQEETKKFIFRTQLLAF